MRANDESGDTALAMAGAALTLAVAGLLALAYWQHTRITALEEIAHSPRTAHVEHRDYR